MSTNTDQRREIAYTIIAQVMGSEIQCARHVFGSVVLQSAIKFGSDEQRVALAKALFNGTNIVSLLTDKYGSHVAEATLASATATGAAADMDSEDSAPTLFTLLPTIIDQLLLQEGKPLVEVLRDSYGTHVLRALFRVLSGRPAHPPRPAARGAADGGWGGDTADPANELR